jgi:hypothetical protein
MPASNDALITREDVKDALKLDETTWDTVLDVIVDAVSQGIMDYCNRSFVERTLTAEKIDGDGTTHLLLRFPIISIDSLVNDTITVVETTNWEMYSDVGEVVLTDGTVWTDGNKKITITYTYGYAVDNLPRNISQAALLLAMEMWREIKEQRTGVSSVTRGDETISYSKEFPGSVKRLVDPYRLLIGGWTV